VTTNDLPVTLESGKSHRVSILVRLPLMPGLFNRKAYFLTDDDQVRTILFSLTGKIEESPAQESTGVSGK